MRCESPGLNLGTAFHTGVLEYFREGWNSTCSGEMRRDVEEYRRRKAAPWEDTDAHVRKRGEQTGLDTLVVHAVKRCRFGGCTKGMALEANVINRPAWGVRPQG